MSIATQIRHLATWKPIQTGEEAPPLSLTADEGTWVKLLDFRGHINVVLLFFRSLNDDATDEWLKSYHQQTDQFEKLKTVVFGISTYRTDKLRDFRSSLGLDFFLLYDPLGIDSRGFRASSRWRPILTPTAVLVDKTGKVQLSERGFASVGQFLQAAASLEGVDLEAEKTEKTKKFTGIRDPGAPAAKVQSIEPTNAQERLSNKDVKTVMVDVRTKAEYEADHVPGALHIPVDELPHRYQEIGQTTDIITVCQTGGVAEPAAEFLTSIGCSDVFFLAGGVNAWDGDIVTGGQQE